MLQPATSLALLLTLLALLWPTPRPCDAIPVVSKLPESVFSATVDIEELIWRRLNLTGRGEGIDTPAVASTADFLLELPERLNATNPKNKEVQTSMFWNAVNKARELVRPINSDPVHKVVRDLTELVAKLHNRLCWPVLRRVIVASVLHRRMIQGEFKAEDNAAITQLFLRLFQLHREAAARKGMVEFFHISKAGGTSFCQLARINGCRTQSFAARRNCLIREFDDTPRWVNNTMHNELAPRSWRTPWFANWGRVRNPVSCHNRKRFLLRRQYNMYANEFTLSGGTRSPRAAHLCVSHVNVLQLRHPYHRLTSHLKWVYALYKFHFHANMTMFFPRTDADYWYRLTPSATDNYYVRSLLGEAAYYLPSSNMTADLLSYAQLLVTQFDVLLVLEETEMNDMLYKLALGWRFGLSSVHARTAAEVQDVGEAGLPPDLREMLKRNELDMELYRFSLLLSLLDAMVFDVAKSVGLGPESGVTLPPRPSPPPPAANGSSSAAGDTKTREALRGAGEDDGVEMDEDAPPVAPDVRCGYVSWFDDDWPTAMDVRGLGI